MSIEEKVEVIGDSLHDIRGAIEGAGITGLGDITTYADAISLLGGGQRGIGEIITSTIPLTDAGVHLLDGSLLQSGSYSNFVTHIADLYNSAPTEDVYNVNIVGSLTNNNGVLSGFTYGVYATIKEVPYSTADSIEILLKTTTGTLDSTNYNCFYAPVISNYRGVNLQINPNGKIQLYVSSNAGSSWDIVNGVVGTTNLQSDTQYYFKYVYTGTNHIVYMSTTGAFAGEETTEVDVTNSSKPSNSAVSLGLQAWSTNQNNYWRGSIDLNESYININGQRWWSGKTERRAGFLTEDEWQQSVTDYGVCGKFVYDSVNNTVRLPKITGIIEGTTDIAALGDLVKAGLPNVACSNIGADNLQGRGTALPPFYKTGVSAGYNVSLSGAGVSNAVGFDLKRANPIYKDNFNKVQPQTIKVLFYIVIANSTKTDIQVDIDEIATDLNGKTDTDLANANNSGKARGAGWAMPSGTYIDLALGASGTEYTAPANGYFLLYGKYGSGANAYYDMYVNGTNIGYRHFFASGTSDDGRGFVPVKKNDTITVVYFGIGVYDFKFIYSIGSESEAS